MKVRAKKALDETANNLHHGTTKLNGIKSDKLMEVYLNKLLLMNSTRGTHHKHIGKVILQSSGMLNQSRLALLDDQSAAEWRRVIHDEESLEEECSTYRRRKRTHSVMTDSVVTAPRPTNNDGLDEEGVVYKEDLAYYVATRNIESEMDGYKTLRIIKELVVSSLRQTIGVASIWFP